MTDFDVVVVGAGAAGVGAGLALQAAGRSFVILEAADRIGGRAYTVRTSSGLAWDHGCHWLHCADVNPLVAWADKTGATYLTQNREGPYYYYLNDGWLNADLRARSGAAVDAAFDAVYQASKAGRDVPVTEVLPSTGPYDGAVRMILQLMASQDPELESASAYGDYTDTEVNWPMVSGYGDLFNRMAQGLPIRTGMPVSAITETTAGVQITTPEGTVTARAAIVTVSTSVLNSGAIHFDSAEVTRVLETAQHMPCGSYEKVAISLRRPLSGLDDALFFSIEPEGQTPMNVQVLEWSDDMVIVHIAGSAAREASRDGADGLRAFVSDRLKLAFGSSVMDDVESLTPTDWENNPLVQGAYSAVLPGYAQARRDLIGIHTGRIGFAGEAFALHWQATAHGAYQSGQDVAERMIREELH